MINSTSTPVPGDDGWAGFSDYVRSRHGLEQLTEVGRGGMGRVYRAWDEELARWVAVKVLDRAAATSESLQRFRQESRTLGQLRHPAIVGVHSAKTSPEGVPYFIMDYVDGGDLGGGIARRRQSNQPYSVAEVVRDLAPVADALDSIHRMNPQVIHRDVKPANILVPARKTTWPSTVLTDFGISVSQDATRMTSAGFLVGTDRYMAPEQFRAVADNGPTPGASVDRYAFALIVYEMLTLRSLRDLMGQDAWRFARRFPGLPQEALAPTDRRHSRAVTDVLARALADNPDHRYPTAASILGTLSAAVAGSTTGSAGTGHTRIAPVAPVASAKPAAPVRPRRSGRRGLGVAVTALILVVAVVAGGLFMVDRLRHPGWVGAEAAIAETFPKLVPDSQHTAGWLGMPCSSASVQQQQVGSILCSGGGYNLVLSDFGSTAVRDQAGSAADLESLSINSSCPIRIGAVQQPSGTAWVVLPQEEAKNRFSLLLSGPDPRSAIVNGMPVC